MPHSPATTSVFLPRELSASPSRIKVSISRLPEGMIYTTGRRKPTVFEIVRGHDYKTTGLLPWFMEPKLTIPQRFALARVLNSGPSHVQAMVKLRNPVVPVFAPRTLDRHSGPE